MYLKLSNSWQFLGVHTIADPSVTLDRFSSEVKSAYRINNNVRFSYSVGEHTAEVVSDLGLAGCFSYLASLQPDNPNYRINVEETTAAVQALKLRPKITAEIPVPINSSGHRSIWWDRSLAQKQRQPRLGGDGGGRNEGASTGTLDAGEEGGEKDDEEESEGSDAGEEENQTHGEGGQQLSHQQQGGDDDEVLFVDKGKKGSSGSGPRSAGHGKKGRKARPRVGKGELGLSCLQQPLTCRAFGAPVTWSLLGAICMDVTRVDCMARRVLL
jgi:hypothetical protein